MHFGERIPVEALLDFRKAFDSVNHIVMKGLLEDIGLLPRMLRYIRNLYGRVELTLVSEWFKQGRGVLQGDPLSPTLFNIIIDYIVVGLNSILGVSLHGKMINALAYADDLVLLASSRAGLQANLNTLVERAGCLGLTLSIHKCATVGLEWRCKSKKVIGDYRSFSINNTEIPVINRNEIYKYLGVKGGMKGPTRWIMGEVERLSSKSSRCGLETTAKAISYKEISFA